MSATPGEGGAALLRSLRRQRERVEVYEKRGRSRSFSRGPEGENVVYSIEAGWSVRAGDAGHSCFRAGSGPPPERLELPPATPHPLQLPPARGRDEPPPVRGLEAALASEAEAMSLLAGVERELERELAGARVVSMRLDDGVSEARVLSSLGVDAPTRARSAALRVEVVLAERRLSGEFVDRSASALKPLAIARRLADRLLALEGGAPLPEAGAPLLLAGTVVARLVEALAPWLVGAGAERALAHQLGVDARLGSPLVRLLDDGSRQDGVLAAPWDGEGVPTGPALLVDEGRLVAPLRAWWEVGDGEQATGCSHRASWRDLPRRGPTQFILEADRNVTVADLVEQGEALAYLVAAEGGVRAAADGSFSLPVCGFALARGRASGALGRCRLSGNLLTWMRGLEARARDLTFVPGDGLYGAPTVRASGLRLEPDASGRTAPAEAESAPDREA